MGLIENRLGTRVWMDGVTLTVKNHSQPVIVAEEAR
jgi:hypothetical protein